LHSRPPSNASRRGSLATLALAALVTAAPGAVRAGVLGREALVARFPPPYLVGERDAATPVWPIFKTSGPPAFTTDLVGYVFESADLAPIPGFAGTPMNLLVAMNTDGDFLDVQLLSQHEPVFLGGIGPEPLVRFLSQYRGLGLKHSIKIGSGNGGAPATRAGSAAVYVDGVAKATASLRIVNQSVLAAALRVARAKLGYSGGRDPDLVAHVRPDVLERRTFDELARVGLLQRLALSNRDVEASFAGTGGAGLDPEALAHPAAPFLDVWTALATVPTAGRNLLDDRAWRTLEARVRPGDHVLLVLWKGRYALADDDYVRGSVPDRVALAQDGLSIELRDLDLDGALRDVGGPPVDGWKAFRVAAESGLDPGAPFTLSVHVNRSRGAMYPERFGKDFALRVAVPEAYLVPAAEDEKTWRSVWKARRVEIAVLVAALALLTWALASRSRLVTRPGPLAWFRPAFLLFTLGFIGWYAQGQLSIVNVVAVLQATAAGRSWAFFLWDPMSTLLWGYAAASLVAWGRGTFCGWLCPFGALQELVARVARLARVPALRVPDRADAWLKRVKYAVLAGVVVAALLGQRASDAAVEVEPFKTAITLLFARSWPAVAWAVALLALGAVVYKGFCRYLCPLGACLALGGVLRRLDWLPRREECGAPCQVCRKRCEYGAIDRAGAVQYSECFQCMDCVAVHGSDAHCAPLILERKGRRAMKRPSLPKVLG
jgi:NosR/NirI family transcriptional regulator, nitrous oxide reductase regulator